MKWCKCNNDRLCMGCKIDKLVRDEYGVEGIKYLLRYTLQWRVDIDQTDIINSSNLINKVEKYLRKIGIILAPKEIVDWFTKDTNIDLKA